MGLDERMDAVCSVAHIAVVVDVAVSHSILDFQARVPVLRYESAWLLKVGERGREVRSVLNECSVRADLEAERAVAGRRVPSC